MNQNLIVENGCSYSICPLNGQVVITPLTDEGLIAGASIIFKKEKTFTALTDKYQVEGGEFTITLVTERGQGNSGSSVDVEEIKESPQTVHIADNFPIDCKHGNIYFISGEEINYSLVNKINITTDENTFATCELYITVANVEDGYVELEMPSNWITCDGDNMDALDPNTENCIVLRVENIGGNVRYLYNLAYSIPVNA